MLNVGTVQATAELNMRRFSQGMKQMRSQGASSSAHVQGSLDGIGSKLRNIQFLASAALGSALVVGARRAVNEFALLEGAMAKFNVVFADQAREMEDWVTTIRQRLPLANREIIAAAASMQDLLVPMGIARREATGMTQQWIELAGALAAFNDVPVDQALEAIRSGIAGQSRPLRQFGIDVRETALQQIALEEGLIKTGQAMDENDRQQALLLQAYKQSKDAVDGYESQLGSTLIMEQNLGATFKDTMAIIGRGLQPTYNALTSTLTELFTLINTGMNSATRRQVALNQAVADMRLELSKEFGEMSFTRLQRMLGTVNEEIDKIASRTNITEGMQANLDQFRELAERLGIALHEVARMSTTADNSMVKLPSTVGDLLGQITELEGKIRDSFDPEQIGRYQHQIKALEIDVAKLTGTFTDLKPIIENVPPLYDHIFPPNMPIERLLSDLELAELAISGIAEEWGSADFGDKIETELNRASGAAQFFSRTLGDGLQHVLFQAQSVEDALRNIIKQLASRAFVTGLMALFSGGLPAGVSFGRAMFGGQFHTGGIVGGTGEKVVRVQGGEGVFTPAQMKAMGSQGGGSINLTVHVKGGTQLSGNDLRYVIDEQVRQIVRLT